MKTVLVLSFTDLASDPRVNRQIRHLMHHFKVIAAGLVNPAIPQVTFIPLGPFIGSRIGAGLLLLLRWYERFYWSRPAIRDGLERLANVKADVILANDLYSLPLALRLARGAKVILDAHEYSPAESDHRLLFRMIVKPYRLRLCRNFLPQVDAMSTVCQGIADRYESEYHLKPTVIINAPDYQDIQPTPVLSGSPIRMVHHGIAAPDRKIENMIETARLLGPRFELTLVLVEPGPGYVDRLKRFAAGLRTVHFHPPVPMLELTRFLTQFDIGLYILEPSNFNNLNSLPNKFFEFIQARLAVAIGPSPEMARIVRERVCGIVAKDFTPRSMADALTPLDHAEIYRFKQHSHAAANDLSTRESMKKLIELVNQVSSKD